MSGSYSSPQKEVSMTITVSSAVSYTLAAAEDNLILTGAANINGNGNALANKIDGNTGANLIKGLGQADILSGFDGNDTIYAGDVGSVDALYVDTLYGGKPEGGLERQALHAFRLAFEHPVTKKPLVHYAPLPQDMAGALDLWGLRYNLPESL